MIWENWQFCWTVDEVSVANEVAEMEKEKIICGYHTLIDWDKAGVEKVNCTDRGACDSTEKSGIRPDCGADL